MRILLIAYYFPPLTGGGSLRPARWADGLRRRGHQVTVLTHTYGRQTADDNEIRVHDPSFNRQRRGRGRLQWLLLRTAVELLNRSGRPASIYGPWRRRALAAGRAFIAESRPDVVVATYSPVETLELGLALSGDGHDLPLVVDFRDGLLFEPIEARRLAAHPAVAHAYARIEAEAVAAAAAVTAALPLVAEDLATRYGLDSTHALANAVDPTEHTAVTPAGLAPDLVHLVHTGGFAASDVTCDIDPFASAVEELLDRRPEAAGRLRIHQLGPLTDGERERLRRLVACKVVIDHGERPRDDCLAHQRAADALLLITSTERASVTPGKLFEYLAAARPILGLTRGTFAADLLDSTAGGWRVAPDDRDGIRRCLSALLDDERPPVATAESLQDLLLASHVERLEEILETAIARQGTRLAQRTVR